MRMRFYLLLWTIAAAAGSLFISCSPLTAAGGSEIGNPSKITVIGRVAYESSGVPVAGADVRLRFKDFCKDTTLAAFPKTAVQGKNTITDAVGRFVLDSVDTGDYIIEVNDGKCNAAAIPCAVRGVSTVKILAVDTVRPTASISGVVMADGYAGSVYAQIMGLDRVVRVDTANGVFVVRDVPAGIFDIRIVSSSPTYQAIRVNRIKVVSGQVTDMDTVRLIRFAGWGHVRQIMLNTTASGASVPGRVYDFPILVRLNEAVFDFSSAKHDGADIRFAKTDSAPLAFEIEHWDTTSGSAAIWVRVDTIIGNNSMQSILMFWGNPEAESASNGTAVFGTDNGFIGTWHLNVTCNDATADHHDGINYGAEDISGISGRAKKFDGGDSIIIDGVLGQPATLTLSGWIMTDTTVRSGQEIVTLGDAVLIRVDEVVGGYGTGGYVHRYTRNGDTAFTKVTTGLNISKTGWRHVVFTFDILTYVHSLYIDGELVCFDTSGYAIDYAGVGSNTFIGAHGNGKQTYNNRGSIDEVRVDRIARSAEWIKLCFMNQRPDDRLVVMK